MIHYTTEHFSIVHRWWREEIAARDKKKKKIPVTCVGMNTCAAGYGAALRQKNRNVCKGPLAKTLAQRVCACVHFVSW
jgi:hypothetical protein